MEREMQTTITVRTSFQGIHRYPDAPTEVKFLRMPHRHIFGVCVEVEVKDDDREIEFIILKNRINKAITEEDGYNTSTGVWDLESGSCEMIADRIASLYLPQFVKDYGSRYVKVTVDEDGENGATIEMWPECPSGIEELIGYIAGNIEEGGEGERGCTFPDKGTCKGCKEKCILSTPVEPVKAARGMTLAEYQSLAYKNIQSHYNRKEEILHWAVGLGEEAGESLSVIKHKYYGGHYDVADIVGELGDTLWHIAALCTALGLDMEDVAKVNLEKLNFRYPDGQFDYNRSEQRHTIGKQFEDTGWYKAMMAKIRKRSDERTNKE